MGVAASSVEVGIVVVQLGSGLNQEDLSVAGINSFAMLLLRITILENSIVQLKKRFFYHGPKILALEKSPITQRIKHFPLAPESNVLAAEINLAGISGRAHAKVMTQNHNATTIGSVTGAA
jgi:hypothetical protein